MAAPTRISSALSSGGWDAQDVGATRTVEVTVQAGDVIVVRLGGEFADVTSYVTPTCSGGGLTWTNRLEYPAEDTTAKCTHNVWTAVATEAKTFTITVELKNTVAGFSFAIRGTVWRGSAGVGKIGSANNGTGSTTPATVNVECAANSALDSGNFDWNATEGTRTWSTINGEAGNKVDDTVDAGTYGPWTAYYKDTGAAGTKTVSFTLSGGSQRWTINAIEILGSAEAPPPPPQPAPWGPGVLRWMQRWWPQEFPPVLGEAGTIFEDAAIGAVVLSGPESAEAAEHEGSATGTVTVTGSGAEAHSVEDARSGAVTVSGSGAEVAEYVDARAGAIVVSGSATEAAEHEAARAGAVVITGSGTDEYESAGTTYTDAASGAVVVSGSAAEAFEAADLRSGAATVSGSATEVSEHAGAASGALTVSGSATEAAIFEDARSGAVVVSGSGTDSYEKANFYEDSGKGSVTISGTASEAFEHAGSAAGIVSISGTATESFDHAFVDTGTGALTVKGAGTESAEIADEGTAIVVISGSGEDHWSTPGSERWEVDSGEPPWEPSGENRWPKDPEGGWPTTPEPSRW